MNEEKQNRKTPMSEEERQRRIAILKEQRKRARRKKAMMLRAGFLGIVLLILIGSIALISHQVKKSKERKKEEKAKQELLIQEEEANAQKRRDTIAHAEKMAKGYDYDGAVELLKSLDNYEKDPKIIANIAKMEADKTSLVPVDMKEVTHVFYRSLIVDPEQAFKGSDKEAGKFKQWMITVEEFQKSIQAMYDNDYILIDLHDMVTETSDDDGTKHFQTAKLMLPEGKKPYVLSLDELSYYHEYEGRGIASKIVLDSKGKPVCEYIQPDGTKVTGAYDCIPILDAFIEEHPDASYKGAKGTIGLTGYQGILGYRTDIAYKTKENLQPDQEKWLSEHSDFNWEKECAEAKKVVEVLKKEGWKFASHTWGNLRVGSKTSLEKLKEDTKKWKDTVEPLVGKTDVIFFPYGEDIGDWHDYTSNNEKYNYLKKEGFSYFCNIDSSQSFLQIRNDYVRQGRRAIDGNRLWNDVHGTKNRTSDLFDASKILDEKRKDMSGV